MNKIVTMATTAGRVVICDVSRLIIPPHADDHSVGVLLKSSDSVLFTTRAEAAKYFDFGDEETV